VVIVPHVLEAEIVVLAFLVVGFRRAVFAGLVAALPGALRRRCMRLLLMPRLDPDLLEKLGIELHRS
jgi:hypothetical protein